MDVLVYPCTSGVRSGFDSSDGPGLGRGAEVEAEQKVKSKRKSDSLNNQVRVGINLEGDQAVDEFRHGDDASVFLREHELDRGRFLPSAVS